MKSLSRGNILVASCVLVIIVSGTALYREITGVMQVSAKNAVGTIVFKKRTAVRKYAEFVIWENLENSSPVFNYDSIRTYPESAAYIKLNNGTEISLDENTMIVLVIDDKDVKINFDQGSVSARSGADNTGNVSLNTRDASISMDSGELSVKKNDEALDVNVFSGNVFVKSGSDLKKIDSASGLRIADGKTEVRKISVLAQDPDNNTIFVTSGSSANVEFTWKSDSAEKLVLEVSPDSGFSRTVVKADVADYRYSAKLAPGDYYWRVSSAGSASAVKKFTLLRDSAFQYQYPGNDERVSISEKDPVKFRWTGSEIAEGTVFELASDEFMNNIVKDARVQVNSMSLEDVKPGTFWWRVRRIYPAGYVPLDPENRPVKFRLERNAIVRAKPVPFSRSIFASTLSGFIMFNWEGSTGARGYIVEISDELEFYKIINSGRTDTTMLRTAVPPEGNYYCRIKADYGNGEYEFSDIILLKVGRPEPVIYLSPLKDEVADNTSEAINFTWKDNYNTGSYIFELASDEKFSRVLATVKTSTGDCTIKSPGEGRFFWRVSIADSKGRAAVKGGASVFIIPGTLARPVTVYPENLATINLDDISVLRFQWQKVRGADTYELEIFHRQDGTDRSLITMTTGSTQIEIRNFSFLEKGTIVWVVRARKKSGSKLAASSESERRYFVLRVSENIRAPKIQTGDTIYVE